MMLLADAAPRGARARGEVMARAESENFPVASRVLPRRVRAHLLAVYGFARLVDELGDTAPGDRLAALDWLERRARRAPSTAAPSTRCWCACSATVARVRAAARAVRAPDRGQPRRPARQPLRDLGAAARLLRAVGRPRRRARARRLRRGDARADRAVGLDLHGAAARRALPGRRRGPRRRARLPAGRGPRALRLRRAEPISAPSGAARPREPLRAVLAFEVARARALLDDGAPLIGELRGRERLAVAAFVAGGRAALDAIERAGYDVLAGPPRASSGAAARAASRCCAGARGAASARRGRS